MELGIPELTDEQIEEACATAENAARKHILSKVTQKLLEKLDISAEAEGAKPVNLTVEIDLMLSSEAEGVNEKELVDDAVKAAFAAVEKYLRRLK